MLWVRARVRARVRGGTSKPGSGWNMSSHLIRDRVRIRDRVEG